MTVVLALVCSASAVAAPISVGGGAYAIGANVNVLVAPASVGALPSVALPPEGGGPYTESLLSANLVGLAAVRAARVSTEGNGGLGLAASSASVLDVGIAGLVSASVARSACSATDRGAEGSASVLGLVVAGIPVSTLNAGPNTTISLPVGTVIVNDQRRVGASQLTVNAVRIRLDAALVAGDIVIAQSRCSVRSSTRARHRRHLRRAGSSGTSW